MKKVCSIFVLTSFLSFNTICFGATIVGTLANNNSNLKSSVLTGIASANEKHSNKKISQPKETSKNEVYKPPQQEEIVKELNNEEGSSEVLEKKEIEIKSNNITPAASSIDKNKETNNKTQENTTKKEDVYITTLATKDGKEASLSVFDSFLKFFNLGSFREMNPVNINRFNFAKNRESDIENNSNTIISENNEKQSVYSSISDWYAKNPKFATTVTVVAGVVIIGGLVAVTGLTWGQAGWVTGPALMSIGSRILPAMQRTINGTNGLLFLSRTNISNVNDLGTQVPKVMRTMARIDKAVLTGTERVIKGGIAGGVAGAGVSAYNIFDGDNPPDQKNLQNKLKDLRKEIANPNSDGIFDSKFQESIKTNQNSITKNDLAQNILNNPRSSDKMKELTANFLEGAKNNKK